MCIMLSPISHQRNTMHINSEKEKMGLLGTKRINSKSINFISYQVIIRLNRDENGALKPMSLGS